MILVNIQPSIAYTRDKKDLDLLLQYNKLETKPSIKDNEMNNKKINLWKDNNIESVNIENYKNVETVDAYTIFYNTKAEPSLELKENLKKYITALNDYKLRISGSDQDSVFSYITMVANNFDIFLPFKAYNPNVSAPYSKGNNIKAYGIVKDLSKNYDKLPGVVRSLNAKDIECILDKDLNKKVKFILIYHESGVESINKQTDFNKIGTLVFPIRIAQKLGIPLINIYNPDAKNKIKQLTGKVIE